MFFLKFKLVRATASAYQMNRTEMFFFFKAIFSQYFAVVEQFVLQFVKINKINIKHTLASLLQIPLRSNPA